MPNDIEQLIRDSAPRVTERNDSLNILMDVSYEAVVRHRTKLVARRKRSWAIGAVAAVAIFGGGTAAVAATHSLWWSEPHTPISAMNPVSNTTVPITQVSCVLEAEYAAGVSSDSAGAQTAFGLAQSWLTDHPVVAAIPVTAQSLTDVEAQKANTDGWALQTALDFKAIAATQPAIDRTAAAEHTALTTGLGISLTEAGANPLLIVVADHGGVCETTQ